MPRRFPFHPFPRGWYQVAYSDVQYETLGRLARALFAAYPLRAVRGHSDVSSPRKTDPGAAFDWPGVAGDHAFERRVEKLLG